MGRQGSAAALMGWISVFVVVAMTMVSMAYAQPQQCNLKTLMPCLKSVKGPYPPEPDVSCCGVVMDYNPACMCTEFVDSKDYPQSYIKNVLAIPKACGRYQLSGYRCGSKYIIIHRLPFRLKS